MLTKLSPALQEWHGKGYSNKKIAALFAHSGLPVSPQTIKAAMMRITEQSGIASQPQTIRSSEEASESEHKNETGTNHQILSAFKDKER